MLTLQPVSGCCAILYLKPIDNIYPWHFRQWVAVMHFCVSGLLNIHIIGSSGSECVLPYFKPAKNAFLGSPVCEWLLCSPIFQACWWCLSLALQKVSGYHALMHFKPVDFDSSECEWLLCLAVFQAWWWCLCLALQRVSDCCALHLKPDDDACLWLSSMWVIVLTCFFFHAWWWCLSLTLQNVSGCCVLLCIMPVDDACPWLFSMWVTTASCCVSCLLMIPVLGSLECEWLLCPTAFQACWWCLSSTLQPVSGCWILLSLVLADNVWPWLFRLWVAAMHCCVSCLLLMPVLGFSACE